MIIFLFSVVLISLSGVMVPGPMLAVTVARSYRSPYTGVLVSLGHLLVELPVILVLYFGLAAFIGLPWFRFATALVGGAFLLYLSVRTFRSRASGPRERHDPGYHSFAAGVVTTLFNPLFYLWWLVIGTALLVNSAPYGVAGFVLLLAVHWMCDIGWLAGVSAIVNRTKRLSIARAQSLVLTLCSAILFAFAGWFLWLAARALQQVSPL